MNCAVSFFTIIYTSTVSLSFAPNRSLYSFFSFRWLQLCKMIFQVDTSTLYLPESFLAAWCSLQTSKLINVYFTLWGFRSKCVFEIVVTVDALEFVDLFFPFFLSISQSFVVTFFLNSNASEVLLVCMCEVTHYKAAVQIDLKYRIYSIVSRRKCC